VGESRQELGGVFALTLLDIFRPNFDKEARHNFANIETPAKDHYSKLYSVKIDYAAF
jgi:hypothetical protein